MMNDIYADGIGNVRLAGTNVRIDLLVVSDYAFIRINKSEYANSERSGSVN